MDLLMVRDRATGRFLYAERLERRQGETSWEYVRRSVRREAHIRDRFSSETQQVIMGWGAGSVEDFLKSYPEYGPTDGEADGRSEPEGETIDR
ncbi:hypothetical protein GBA63_03770 [Rubrobacter tropicus]|uniref:Uncharacterized protein n=1 Tax=Rubrobacter tropicus TaxID=2653851 RepID=A0A6G8Q5V1_9ACTN|nr:hypothetical protein [Rubrobacter tropicus]QIN81855.1 hypothetical protein GBA63_03770 [Rubrobacter tropicus]